MHVKKQQLELVMEQQTSSTLRKECIVAVYVHIMYIIHHVKCWGTHTASRFFTI